MERRVKVRGFNQEIELILVDEESFGDVKFIHPGTGAECQKIKQIRTGWSFQSSKENEEYQKLIDSINESIEDNMIFDFFENLETLDIHSTIYG